MCEESGLDWYYFGARYYDPVIGRWLQVDPKAYKKPWLSPYVYCSNSPTNRFDPDGNTDYKAAITSGIGMVGSGAAIGTGFLTMIGTSYATIQSGGSASPITVPSFLKGFAVFTGGVTGFGISLGNFVMALKTPDGLTAKQYSMVTEINNAFGGNKLSGHVLELLSGAKDLKGITSITEKGLVFLIQKLSAAGKSADEIMNILNELYNEQGTQGEGQNQQQDNIQQSDSDNDDSGDDDEEKKKTDNSWWDDYDPSRS